MTSAPSPAARPAGAGAAALKRCPACGELYPDDYAVCPRDASRLTRDSDDPLVGRILGDTYELLRRLGEGGMGRVYEARQIRLGRRFAVKILHDAFSTDPGAVARFRREATAAAAIRSSYVAEVVDVNVTPEGRPYIVHELLEGETLADKLDREGPMPLGRAVRLVRFVCRAAAAAHATGIVHRDLKPENLMIVRHDGREITKVLDFGIAKSLLGDASLTRTGTIVGTPAYMAPEQARGAPDVDYRADVYALGAILYCAVTGRAPFTDEDPTTTLTRVLQDEPERPKTLRRDLPDGLELVIQRAMAKAPADRTPSMVAFDEALAPFDVDTADAPVAVPTAASIPVPAEIGRAETVAVTTHSGLARSEEPEKARGRVVLRGALLAGWSMASVASLLAWSMQYSLDRPLVVVERILALVVALAVVAPLAIGWVRRLGRGPWRNTAAMVVQARGLGEVLVGSLCAFAIVEAVARATLVVAGAREIPAPVDLLAWLAAIAVGGILASRRLRT